MFECDVCCKKKRTKATFNNCRHFTCQSCVLQWQKHCEYNLTCPTCRAPITEYTVHRHGKKTKVAVPQKPKRPATPPPRDEIVSPAMRESEAAWALSLHEDTWGGEWSDPEMGYTREDMGFLDDDEV